MTTSALIYVDQIGRRLLKIFEYTINIFIMVYLSFRATIHDNAQSFRTILNVVSSQIYFTGFQALPLISILALACGSIVIMQSTSQLSLLGGGNLVGPLLVTVILREVGPLMTALVVVARSGTAVATELGNMKANQEISALESMGINPLSYVVFPRMLGGIVSVLTLAFYFNVIALIGGFIITQFTQHMPLSYYMATLANSLTIEDFWIFMLKNTFSGAIIFTICCHQGLQVHSSPHEVPQVTTKAVVNSIIYVVSFNMIVTILFYLKKLLQMGVL